MSDIWDKTKNSVHKAWDKTKEFGEEAVDKTKHIFSNKDDTNNDVDDVIFVEKTKDCRCRTTKSPRK